MAAPTPITIPTLENEVAVTMLPGGTIRGLTGRSIGIFGRAITNGISNFAQESDNIEGQSNANTRGSNIFFRTSAAVFMAHGKVDQTLIAQYVPPTFANPRADQNLNIKGTIENLNARLRLGIFGNQQLYRYILSCWDDYVQRAALDGLPAIDTLTPDQAAAELTSYFTDKVFLHDVVQDQASHTSQGDV